VLIIIGEASYWVTVGLSLNWQHIYIIYYIRKNVKCQNKDFWVQNMKKAMTITLRICDCLFKYPLTFTVRELLSAKENLNYYWGLILIKEVSTWISWIRWRKHGQNSLCVE
jgi:hypothetical protein